MCDFLIYTSKSAIKHDKELANILEQAISFNAQKDITGVLLFDGSHFLQILEGEHEQINMLYSSIEKDPRHTDVLLKIIGVKSKRNFSDWSMRISRVAIGSIKLLHNMNCLEFEKVTGCKMKNVILSILSILIDDVFFKSCPNDLSREKFFTLSTRENKILELLVKGETSKEIGFMLNISSKTVFRHIENIKKKCNCDTSKELIRKVFSTGYINNFL